MDDQEKQIWLHDHLPYRVRLLIACSSRLNEYMQHYLGEGDKDYTTWFWKSKESMTNIERIVRRCETDAISEGRLATLRWFIEFIGAKRGKQSDIGIGDLGGPKFSGSNEQKDFLDSVWVACSQRVVHSGQHPSEALELTDSTRDAATCIIINHLSMTVYRDETDWIKKYVLNPSED